MPSRIAAVALFGALAFAQEQEPGASGLVIRSTTALVQVRVVAEDGDGKPVTDLQKSDFQIQDDRKPQTIAMFNADRGTAAAATHTPGAAPEKVSDSGPAYALVVLDWLNTWYGDQVRAQEAAAKMLKSFQPSQKIALFVLSHHSSLLADFTDDVNVLSQLAASAELDSTELGKGQAVGRFDARYTGRAAPQDMEYEMFTWNEKILDSMEALDKMADRFARMPGRKSLIWVSDGFPTSVGPKGAKVSYQQEFETLIEKLNRADVGVYTIVACGLSPRPCGYPLTLREVSERTGATSFYDRNDLDEGIRAALEDHAVGYTLAYRLPDHHEVGPHEIHVTVKRKGVTLRYRESYELVDR